MNNEAARDLPATYILTVEAGAAADSFTPFADRARERGWNVLEMEADHNPQWPDPHGLVELLLSIP